MVKFSKQFEAQLVPEWKEAFVNYRQLKKELRKLQRLKQNQEKEALRVTKDAKKRTCCFSLSFPRMSPLVRRLCGHSPKDHGAIQVHRKLTSSASRGDVYETELLEQFFNTEAARGFFSMLDAQLNKVNQFYKNKEKEYLDRGESIEKQMMILTELKTTLKQQQSMQGSVPKEEDSSISSSTSISLPCGFTGEEEYTRADAVDLQDQPPRLTKSDLEKINGASVGEWTQLDQSTGVKRDEKKLGISKSFSARPFSCQGKNLRMEIPLTTPSRTLSALGLAWEDLVSQYKKCGSDGSKLKVNKATLQHAEKMIRRAFMELYKGLDYLKTFRTLNMTAFMKILKKFDKVTEQQILPIYLKVVESSYFNISDKALKKADEVEEAFAKNFMDNDHGKAMKYLKPHQRKESHAVTFFTERKMKSSKSGNDKESLVKTMEKISNRYYLPLFPPFVVHLGVLAHEPAGLFAGCFTALFAGYIGMAHMAGLYTRQTNPVYMETVYPVFCMFSLLFLHLFLYGCNIIAWRRARINYCFIFEFASTRELKYRDVFLTCATCMTVVVGVMLAHLYVVAKDHSSPQVDAIPGLLLLIFLVLLVCPFNIIYKSTRYCFLRIIRNIVLAPLYKVVMVDFFMADQFCSQVPMLRSLEYVTCYYITGSYMTHDYNFCHQSKHYRDLVFAVSFLPYYWRAMQCAKRWFDEGQSSHLVNLGKYLSAMIAAGAKVAYEREKGVGWLSLLIITSSTATVYQLYWDFVKDWGLLQFRSRNPWLRDELMLRHKVIYYFSMGVNLVFRLAWLQTAFHSNLESVDYRVTGFFLASLEVIRRGQWNFYRLENEHLNNAGKFRAVKTVPLPFHEVDED